MRVALLVPGPISAVSGGYGYDRRIVAELRAAGHAVEVHELGGRHPLPDDAAALREIEQRMFPALTGCIVTSETTAATLAGDFAVPATRLASVVPGTDPAPRGLGSGGDTCRILSIGTLIPRKGHELLLRALARLFDLDWHLTIAGGAPDPVHAASLRNLAEDLKIAQRVDFVGVATGEALEALWRGADVFALATEYEGYGMAIAEALKRGLPVAITKGGAAGALVPVEAGVVCEVGDLVTYSKALRRVIFDVELRAEMAQAAWEAGQKLPDWAAQGQDFADALARFG